MLLCVSFLKQLIFHIFKFLLIKAEFLLKRLDCSLKELYLFIYSDNICTLLLAIHYNDGRYVNLLSSIYLLIYLKSVQFWCLLSVLSKEEEVLGE